MTRNGLRVLAFGSVFTASLAACALAVSFDDFVELPKRPDEASIGDVAPESEPVVDAALGGLWTNLTPEPRPAAWPPPRATWAFVYDSNRDKFILWGGVRTDGAVPLDDLWEWDPTSREWANRTPSPRPAAWPEARTACAAVYDSKRRTLVLFGGNTSSGALSDETWEYDGESGTWSNRTPAMRPSSWPAPRSQISMAYDSARGKTVLFSGHTGGSPSGDVWAPTADTWEWDGDAGTWTPRPTTVTPGWGVDGRMAYDSRRGTVLYLGPLFGGNPGPELWEWDGNAGTWTNRTPSPLPKAWPPWRSGHGLAYDGNRQRLVLFAGTDHKNDVWEYSAASSTWRGTLDASPPWPSGREFFGMTFDEKRPRSLVFGGNALFPDGGTGGSDELWAWQGL